MRPHRAFRTAAAVLTLLAAACTSGGGPEGSAGSPTPTYRPSGDLVVMAFAREYPDPKDPSQKYTTTWFDMFRLADGKIAEHWDPATRPVPK